MQEFSMDTSKLKYAVFISYFPPLHMTMSDVAESYIWTSFCHGHAWTQTQTYISSRVPNLQWEVACEEQSKHLIQNGMRVFLHHEENMRTSCYH